MDKPKPNCYNCIFRRNLSGDAHSKCAYPGAKNGLLDFFESDNMKVAKRLNIIADAHGVKSGWFFWPCNFDPVWLINCDGFTLKGDAAYVTN